jgi:anti-sigma-K factor RskA
MAMSAAEKMSRRDEMEALLPFYLNGTLEGADLAAVEEWLATDPVAGAALDAAEAEFAGTTAANEAIRAPADALSRFVKTLEAEAGPDRAAASKPSNVVSLWSRLSAIPAGAAWAVAAALLALVIVQQVSRPGGEGGGFEVAGADSDLAGASFALVTFKPDATMAEIAAFLSGNGLKIATGPNADGVFRIALPAKTAADYDRLLALIAGQPFVQAALAGRKPADG